MPGKRYTTQVTDIQTLAPSVIQLRTDKPIGFEFDAGEFVRFVVASDDKEDLRAYSICSKPKDDYLEFLIKLIRGGVASEMIRRLSVGDDLTFEGPMGRFKYQDDGSVHYFIATGVGIAPIMSIIRHQFENRKNDDSAHLLFGLRSEQDLFWEDRLMALQDENKNFTYKLTLSQSSLHWSGMTGRVTRHMPASPEASYYLCGSGAMVQEARSLLIEKKVDTRRIHFEIF